MKSLVYTLSGVLLFALVSFKPSSQEFTGQAVYYSKSKLELGRFGARMSEAQKKQIQARLKNRLEKTYVLSFNLKESFFEEEEKLDAISGATDSWGANFSQGDQYKNVKENALVQSQEFYGKKFLVKDELLKIDWKIGKESKKIGNYLCFKATAEVPSSQLEWYNFSWRDLRRKEEKKDSIASETPAVEMTEIEAWYTPQIPVSHGPSEFGGLPGLILEVSYGNTIMLCSKVTINPKEEIVIEAPKRGKEITKEAYQQTIREKMVEMRNNRGRRRQ
ncbi:GLPGLI family protein [Tenacibaculum tangerinum]|uniref:GLPGLI family protein n=1 Tax=Tenacibaculum tangerinum TaxID=3038772 RepID=A0ABY8L4N5_9FLAO|nr:GLPGLI family protein [Tenacibaculum tangerinum]WGH76387.1 GLPGLI family protein [Tenacibaculum tangerinum]